LKTEDFNPSKLAALYYFGDLQYWKLPGLAVDALVNGYDGVALRKLAGLNDVVESDLSVGEIDSAFQEMGVAAPVPKGEAVLILATEAVKSVIYGDGNVFDVATHIRIHLCGLENPMPELRRIVELSVEATHAPRHRWNALEEDLRAAMNSFLSSRNRPFNPKHPEKSSLSVTSQAGGSRWAIYL
jgi:hypothetical protein